MGLLSLWRVVNRMLYGDRPEERWDPANVETRKKVFGRELITENTIRMSQLSIQSKFTPSEWEAMSLEERGEWAAFYTINNIEEIMKRYYDVWEEHFKQLAAEAEKKRNGKG